MDIILAEMAATWEQAAYSGHQQCWTEYSMIIASQTVTNSDEDIKNLYSEVPNSAVCDCNY